MCIKNFRFFQLFFVLGFVPYPGRSEIQAVLLNNFTIPKPGFTTILHTHPDNLTSWKLLISSFSSLPQSPDSIYIVTDIQTKLQENISPVQVTNEVTWPNNVLSADIFIPSSILVPGGFLVPAKSNGNLNLISPTNDLYALVPQDETKTWFYHDAVYKDMDKDGLIDIVTARAHFPLGGRPTSQLIWLKNPGGNLEKNVSWEVRTMGADDGPDVDLQFACVDSIQVLFTNGYFSRKLQMFWSDSNDLWNDSSRVHVRDIDTEPRSFFTIRLTIDLNGDQRPDLLVTDNDPKNGSLIAYELPPPGEILLGNFKRHVLATGFKPFHPSNVGGAPGHAEPIKLSFLKNRNKPVIVLSGDDDGCLYLLEAMYDKDPFNWQYTITKLYDSNGSIVGQMSIADVDEDGYPEVFVPVYNYDSILIYRLMNNGVHLKISSFVSYFTFVGVFIHFLNFFSFEANQ